MQVVDYAMYGLAREVELAGEFGDAGAWVRCYGAQHAQARMGEAEATGGPGAQAGQPAVQGHHRLEGVEGCDAMGAAGDDELLEGNCGGHAMSVARNARVSMLTIWCVRHRMRGTP